MRIVLSACLGAVVALSACSKAPPPEPLPAPGVPEPPPTPPPPSPQPAPQAPVVPPPSATPTEPPEPVTAAVAPAGLLGDEAAVLDREGGTGLLRELGLPGSDGKYGKVQWLQPDGQPRAELLLRAEMRPGEAGDLAGKTPVAAEGCYATLPPGTPLIDGLASLAKACALPQEPPPRPGPLQAGLHPLLDASGKRVGLVAVLPAGSDPYRTLIWQLEADAPAPPKQTLKIQASTGPVPAGWQPAAGKRVVVMLVR